MRLPLLCQNYTPTTFDYVREPEQPELPTVHHWIDVFRAAISTFAQHGLTDEAVAGDRQVAADKFVNEYSAILDCLDADPTANIAGHAAQPLNCISLCAMRERCLKTAGFKDIFKAVKDKENAQALSHLQDVLQELDAQSDAAARWSLALRGVFAGNIFDLGAATSAQLYAQNGASSSFTSTRDALVPRPWVFDHLDHMLQRACPSADSDTAPYSKVLMFVDNAGSDVVLGMLPLAREFFKSGSQVVIAANEGPSCNDILVSELLQLLEKAASLDTTISQAISSGKLKVVSSGNWLPVIDLNNVSEELVKECEGVDLVILEGMGRAIETNLHAKFTCDSWKLGMIKHVPVAKCLGGRLYDCVCKFDEAVNSL